MSESADKSKENSGAASSDSPEKREPAWWMKSISVVFASVMAPLLVAAGMKYIDRMGAKPAPLSDTKAGGNATASVDPPSNTGPVVPASSSKSTSNATPSETVNNTQKSQVGTKPVKTSAGRDSKKALKGVTTTLFNGTDLAAFAPSETEGVFIVDPSAKTLILSASSKGEGAKLSTKDDYSNYSLNMEYQFRGATTSDKQDGKVTRRGSVAFHGSLLDGQGDAGSSMGYFCLLGDGSTGDLRITPLAKNAYSMSAEAEQVQFKSRSDKSIWSGLRYRPGAPLVSASGTLHVNYAEAMSGKNPSKNPEKADGEWNQLELRCDRDRVTVMINGKVVNQATRLSRTSGRIVLRPAGVDIAIRKIELSPL